MYNTEFDYSYPFNLPPFQHLQEKSPHLLSNNDNPPHQQPRREQRGLPPHHESLLAPSRIAPLPDERRPCRAGLFEMRRRGTQPVCILS